ncbi:MAG: potassium/proton antiporter [Phycisphaeraceae bacterium]|nr:potassium/proton antiporter [Phycisphaeraceae bacterium]
MLSTYRLCIAGLRGSACVGIVLAALDGARWRGYGPRDVIDLSAYSPTLILATSEPTASAIVMVAFGAILVFSVVFGRPLDRLGIPVVLLFLLLGILAGSEGLGGIPFDDYGLAYRLGTLALALILFDGGLNTSLSVVRRASLPAGILATVGVALTAGLVAMCARMIGLPWPESLLLGAVVSSTDAATVFAVLRGGRLRLKDRVGSTLELESGVNDPMAVLLTAMLVQAILASGGSGPVSWWRLAIDVPVQLLIGLAFGVMFGLAGRWFLARVRLGTVGLYPVVTLALALLAFGGATLCYGSGFLAVYAAGVVLGNGPLPYKSGLARVHDAIAWLSQIGMFGMLGLLVYPSSLASVWGEGLALGLFLAFVARPIAVAVCLGPLRMPAKEIGYIGWVGLRGAVPIVLATYPMLEGVPGAGRVFNIVFFIVVVNALIPGSTVRLVTRKLGLDVPDKPVPEAVLEINARKSLDSELLAFHIDRSLAVCDAALSQIAFPRHAAVVLVVRGEQMIAPRGDTRLHDGDHVYVLCKSADRPFIELLFGRPIDDQGPSAGPRTPDPG